ncbi:MAG: cell surface protein [Opitutales bacterium]|nr:cell surface protein [Opitutales bacterium]MCH8539248.1 cell surface protein [Opitutales bacterium]
MRQTFSVVYRLLFAYPHYILAIVKKLIILLSSLLSLAFLSGCDDVVLNDLTPSAMPENPSGIYTITLEVDRANSSVHRDSIEPSIVIDGQIYPMERSRLGSDIWEFDYRLPQGRRDASYYFQAEYVLEPRKGFPRTKETASSVKSLRIVSRYAMSLESHRAPVGTKVGLVGRGFRSGDEIMVGDLTAETIYHGPNSLSFYVPMLEPGQNYPVMLIDGNRSMRAGVLRVDGAQMRVTPSSLSFAAGESRNLVFTLHQEAPPGGLRIPVTTDIPDSVIMPEVMVPGGARTVNVRVTGDRKASGSLFVEAPGFDEIEIPVQIND